MAAVVCGLLLLAVAVVFGQTVNHEFVNYDDDEYVYDNQHITNAPPAIGIKWAFTSIEVANWHPLTWLSHILDYQLYGLHAGGHHLTSILLHAITTILLFLVLWRMTSDLWPSAFVAAVFAVHPLHVESVAWVAERKDVLSGLLFVLTLWSYARYVERPRSWGRYMTVVLFFALGLMSKPMLVTVPFVLLLLDYWPLGRMRPLAANSALRLVIEKIPLLLLAVASCVVTLAAQARTIQPEEFVPLSWRIGNALVSYVAYLYQFVYPVGLAVFYPHPSNNLSIWQVAAALLMLVGISLAVLVARHRHPYLLVGWFWYVGMLVPVIGLIQVGWQSMADRYTYLPQIGLCMALAWGVVNVVGPWSNYRRLLSVFSMLVVAILIGCAWRQTGYWQDSKSLWTHALACTSNNAVADYNLGVALEKCGGATDEVIDHYRKAVKIMPDFPAAQNNLGVTLAKRGLFDEAIIHYKKALDIDPDYAQAQSNLAAALAKIGLFDEAMDHFREALRIKPDFAEAHCNLGKVLAKFGRIDEAVDHFQEALRIKPDYTGARQNLDALRSERAKKTTGTFWFFRKAECLIC